MATVNGFKFPSVADELIGLHHLEWRLLSPRIPFMKIYADPRGGQKKIRGNVVNVVSNTQGTYTKLPKMSNEQDTIAVKLKRNLRYESSYIQENVRPEIMKRAAKYLVKQNLFKRFNIVYDPN